MAQLGSLGEEMEKLRQVYRMMEAFKAFDSDDDGHITSAELEGILVSLGHKPSKQEVKEMMQQGDTNKDGLLSIEEFLDMNTKAMELPLLAPSLPHLSEALDDVEGDQILTAEALYQLIGALGSGLSFETCQDIIVTMDGDCDGAVPSDDFKIIIDSLL